MKIYSLISASIFCLSLSACGPTATAPNPQPSASNSSQTGSNPVASPTPAASESPSGAQGPNNFPDLTVNIRGLMFTIANSREFLTCALNSSNNDVFKGTLQASLQELNTAAAGSDEGEAKKTLTKVASDISTGAQFAPGCPLPK